MTRAYGTARAFTSPSSKRLRLPCRCVPTLQELSYELLLLHELAQCRAVANLTPWECMRDDRLAYDTRSWLDGPCYHAARVPAARVVDRA